MTYPAQTAPTVQNVAGVGAQSRETASPQPDETLGTQDLECNMRPSKAGAFAVILVNVLVILLVFNSAGLVRWTQRLPSSPANAWLAERAADWDRLMQVPPGRVLNYVREQLRVGQK